MIQILVGAFLMFFGILLGYALGIAKLGKGDEK